MRNATGNQLHALAMGEGVCRKKLFSKKGRAELLISPVVRRGLYLSPRTVENGYFARGGYPSNDFLTTWSSWLSSLGISFGASLHPEVASQIAAGSPLFPDNRSRGSSGTLGPAEASNSSILTLASRTWKRSSLRPTTVLPARSPVPKW